MEKRYQTTLWVHWRGVTLWITIGAVVGFTIGTVIEQMYSHAP